MAATSAFKTIPPDIMKLSDNIMQHCMNEEIMLSKVLDYMASFNRHRCELISKIPSSDEGFTTSMQVPRCPPRASNGLFPSDLMGSDIIPFLKAFNPEQYVALPLVACDDSIFSICLQGANIAKAVWIWLSLLKWPPDVDVENPSDWGISWFELTVSFYLCTGFRFPLRISGAGNKSVYVEYGSDDALVLPGHQRSAVLQGICLRNMIQNLLTVSEQKIFPSFKTFKCRSLTRLGLKGVVAGVGRRPVLPNNESTMDFVAKYMANLQGNALNEPIFSPGLQTMVSFLPLDEPCAAARFNGNAAFMKRRRKMAYLQSDG